MLHRYQSFLNLIVVLLGNGYMQSRSLNKEGGYCMAFEFRDLYQRTRELMLEEVQYDIERSTLYMSDRLTPAGKDRYPQLLQESVMFGNSESLATALRGHFNPTEQRRKPSGGYITSRVPSNAPEVLAEGEFNRFYIRALCRMVLEEGTGELRVYRAKIVASPRPESIARIGLILPARALLSDLRHNPGVDLALGVPSGPCSGLSVEPVR
jgi:hypothetical protein